jgi:DNA polymerase-3 subunit alpha
MAISARPLEEMTLRMSTATDCTLGSVSGRPDGELVTVGGIIAETKRLLTKRGGWMMLATLEDMDGSVELIVFGKAMEDCGEALAADAIVVVRGRVDHRDKGRTCVVVQKVERFGPENAR